MIELESVHRIFQVGDQEVHALNDIDLTIADGEYVSIMGPSGSGKSTLLNILGLLDKPDKGIYRLDGRDTTTLSDDEQAAVRGEKIGFTFQFFHLIPRLTAAENVELPMLLAGTSPAERRDKVNRILEDVGMADRAHHRPDQLSGGQRQRVAIARATIMNPSVLLADEPTGNLDSSSGADVVEILEKLNNNGLTLIVVTHDRQIGSRATRCIRMVDGRIAEDMRVEKSCA
jgi:putative ABC transport system ATP-binding protein